jgi:hypothetical protein
MMIFILQPVLLFDNAHRPQRKTSKGVTLFYVTHYVVDYLVYITVMLVDYLVSIDQRNKHVLKRELLF